jgi:hypothetical protein
VLEILSNPLVSIPMSFFISVLAAAFYDLTKKGVFNKIGPERHLSALDAYISYLKFINRSIFLHRADVYFSFLKFRLHINMFSTTVFAIMGVGLVVTPQHYDFVMSGVNAETYDIYRQWAVVAANVLFGVGTAMTGLSAIQISKSYLVYFNPDRAVEVLRRKFKKAAPYMSEDDDAKFKMLVKELAEQTYAARDWIAREGDRSLTSIRATTPAVPHATSGDRP